MPAFPGVRGVQSRARRVVHLASMVTRAALRTQDRSSFPIQTGRMVVDGPEGRLEVVRDRWSVPHVFASSARDAFFGHGFVHAQDRLFRMEGARRLAAGRLAELSGGDALPSDRLMRRVGLARAARRDVTQLPAASREMLDAYARGVNAGVATLPALPPEFVFLGDTFEPWTAEDSLLVGLLVQFGFAGNWVTELIREELALALGAERASVLDPVHPPASTVTGREHRRAVSDLLFAYEAACKLGLPSALASNAWVVNGERSVTGRPLLASDPHVEVALPGLFHVAHLMGGEVNVVGAGVPGVPGVLIGHNEAVAWGITAGMADVADCYVEEFECRESRRYRTPDGWAEAEEVLEVIEVLGGEAVDERILVTRHGPVVSPAIGDGRAIALRSSVVEGGDMASPFLGLARAASLDEAESALDGWPGATFNFVLASTGGGIGYRFAGRVPRRGPGAGLLPQSGVDSAGPPAYVAVPELPRLRDPADGFVVSANNAPGSDVELGEEWCEPCRWERLRDLLNARPTHDIESFAAMQSDRYSANLVRLRDLILQVGGVQTEVHGLLSAWDGQLNADSAAAALVHATYRVLAYDLTERLAGPHAEFALGGIRKPMPANSAFAYRSQGMHIEAAVSAASPWFTSEVDRDRTIRGTLARSIEFIRAECGDEPGTWNLGAIQQLPFQHALHAVPGLGRWWSRGERPFGGDVNTVLQAQGWAWGEQSTLRIAPGYRQLIDVGDWDSSLFMLPTGESGIPGHPRYDDCIDEYMAGTYRPLLFSESAVRLAAESTLVLDPLARASSGSGSSGA